MCVCACVWVYVNEKTEFQAILWRMLFSLTIIYLVSFQHGVTFDQSDGFPLVQFYKNGQLLKNKTVRDVRGEVCEFANEIGSAVLTLHVCNC